MALFSKVKWEIEYPDEKIIYKKGDGVFIPDGPEHKHRGRVITESAKVIFIGRCWTSLWLNSSCSNISKKIILTTNINLKPDLWSISSIIQSKVEYSSLYAFELPVQNFSPTFSFRVSINFRFYGHILQLEWKMTSPK